LAEQLTLNPLGSAANAAKSGNSSDRAAQGAAVDAENGPIEPDLQAVIDAWPALPDAVKAGILAMVRSTTEPDEA
jgi:hypothetical protein